MDHSLQSPSSSLNWERSIPFLFLQKCSVPILSMSLPGPFGMRHGRRRRSAGGGGGVHVHVHVHGHPRSSNVARNVNIRTPLSAPMPHTSVFIFPSPRCDAISSSSFSSSITAFPSLATPKAKTPGGFAESLMEDFSLPRLTMTQDSKDSATSEQGSSFSNTPRVELRHDLDTLQLAPSRSPKLGAGCGPEMNSGELRPKFHHRSVSLGMSIFSPMSTCGSNCHPDIDKNTYDTREAITVQPSNSTRQRSSSISSTGDGCSAVRRANLGFLACFCGIGEEEPLISQTTPNASKISSHSKIDSENEFKHESKSHKSHSRIKKALYEGRQLEYVDLPQHDPYCERNTLEKLKQSESLKRVNLRNQSFIEDHLQQKIIPNSWDRETSPLTTKHSGRNERYLPSSSHPLPPPHPPPGPLSPNTDKKDSPRNSDSGQERSNSAPPGAIAIAVAVATGNTIAAAANINGLSTGTNQSLDSSEYENHDSHGGQHANVRSMKQVRMEIPSQKQVSNDYHSALPPTPHPKKSGPFSFGRANGQELSIQLLPSPKRPPPPPPSPRPPPPPLHLFRASSEDFAQSRNLAGGGVICEESYSQMNGNIMGDNPTGVLRARGIESANALHPNDMGYNDYSREIAAEEDAMGERGKGGSNLQLSTHEPASHFAYLDVNTVPYIEPPPSRRHSALQQSDDTRRKSTFDFSFIPEQSSSEKSSPATLADQSQSGEYSLQLSGNDRVRVAVSGVGSGTPYAKEPLSGIRSSLNLSIDTSAIDEVSQKSKMMFAPSPLWVDTELANATLEPTLLVAKEYSLKRGRKGQNEDGNDMIDTEIQETPVYQDHSSSSDSDNDSETASTISTRHDSARSSTPGSGSHPLTCFSFTSGRMNNTSYRAQGTPTDQHHETQSYYTQAKSDHSSQIGFFGEEAKAAPHVRSSSLDIKLTTQLQGRAKESPTTLSSPGNAYVFGARQPDDAKSKNLQSISESTLSELVARDCEEVPANADHAQNSNHIPAGARRLKSTSTSHANRSAKDVWNSKAVRFSVRGGYLSAMAEGSRLHRSKNPSVSHLHSLPPSVPEAESHDRHDKTMSAKPSKSDAHFSALPTVPASASSQFHARKKDASTVYNLTIPMLSKPSDVERQHIRIPGPAVVATEFGFLPQTYEAVGTIVRGDGGSVTTILLHNHTIQKKEITSRDTEGFGVALTPMIVKGVGLEGSLEATSFGSTKHPHNLQTGRTPQTTALKDKRKGIDTFVFEDVHLVPGVPTRKWLGRPPISRHRTFASHEISPFPFFSFSLRQGTRKSMQDTISIIPYYHAISQKSTATESLLCQGNSEDQIEGLFALCDGHGRAGRLVAEFVADALRLATVSAGDNSPMAWGEEVGVQDPKLPQQIKTHTNAAPLTEESKIPSIHDDSMTTVSSTSVHSAFTAPTPFNHIENTTINQTGRISSTSDPVQDLNSKYLDNETKISRKAVPEHHRALPYRIPSPHTMSIAARQSPKVERKTDTITIPKPSNIIHQPQARKSITGLNLESPQSSSPDVKSQRTEAAATIGLARSVGTPIPPMHPLVVNVSASIDRSARMQQNAALSQSSDSQTSNHVPSTLSHSLEKSDYTVRKQFHSMFKSMQNSVRELLRQAASQEDCTLDWEAPEGDASKDTNSGAGHRKLRRSNGRPVTSPSGATALAALRNNANTQGNDTFTSEYSAGGAAVTAVRVSSKEKKLWVASVGDVRAFIVRSGFPVELTVDDYPDRPDEQRRISKLGGHVFTVGGQARVAGELGVSRAIGDANYEPYVSWEPTVTRINILPGDILVMSSDGLFQKMTVEEVSRYVHDHGCKSGLRCTCYVDRVGEEQWQLLLSHDIAVRKSQSENKSKHMADTSQMVNVANAEKSMEAQTISGAAPPQISRANVPRPVGHEVLRQQGLANLIPSSVIPSEMISSSTNTKVTIPKNSQGCCLLTTARCITEEALRRGARDNISCLVVDLDLYIRYLDHAAPLAGYSSESACITDSLSPRGKLQGESHKATFQKKATKEDNPQTF